MIALALLPTLQSVGVGLLRLARLARVAHVLRHLTQLRLLDVLKRTEVAG